MTKAHILARSLLGKHRISIKMVEGEVNNIRLVDEILKKHGYQKVFSDNSIHFKGWTISESYINHNEYLA